MGWEERRNGKTYYYQKRREGGRVISEYAGHGVIADLSASIDANERHEHHMARLALADFINAQHCVDRLIDDYRAQVRQLVKDTLQQAGFHQHRGQWRFRRDTPDMADEVASKSISGAELVEYLRLVAAAQGKSKGAALNSLRDYAGAHPAIFDHFGALAHTTLAEVIRDCSDSATTQIQLLGEAQALQRSLGIAIATPLEKLLIQDVTICWLRMQGVEQIYSANFNTGDGVTLTKAAYLENRLSATHRRYLQSIESLARVRGLLARVGIQINLAQQQLVVNG